MDRRLLEFAAGADIAGMESRKTLEQHEIWLPIEEVDGSFRAPSICPSMMSLALDEDKNNGIKC